MSKLRNASILRTSLAGVFQRFAQLLSSLITLPLVLHCDGVAGFGVWGAATSLAWLSGLLTLGFGAALVTLIPRGLAAGKTLENRGYVTAALHGSILLSAALLLGGVAAWRLGAPVPRPPFLIAGVTLILNIPLGLSPDIWLALQKGHIAAFWGAVQTVLGLVFIIIGALAGAGVTLMVLAIYGALLLSNAGSLAHVLVVHPHIRPVWKMPPAAMRMILSQGGLIFLATIAWACATAFDNVLVLEWLGPAASARMAVAMRVCVTATGMLGAVTSPFWPSFADALAAEDHAWARRTLWLGTAAVFALSICGCTVLIAFGAPLLNWWLHQDLHITKTLLWAMAAWITCLTLTNVPSTLLTAALELKVQILSLAVAAIVGFGLKYLVAAPFGVPGILLVPPALWLFLVTPCFWWKAWGVTKQTRQVSGASRLV